MQKRPLGISIISVLSIISGLGLLILQILYRSNLGQLVKEFDTSAIIFFMSATFISIASILSGIGMLRGKKWGWWLGAFCILYAVIRNANALISIYEMADIIENSTRGMGYYFTKHVGRIITNSLVFAYFFKENVLEYFEMLHYSKKKSISQLIGICIVVFIIFSIISRILNS